MWRPTEHERHEDRDWEDCAPEDETPEVPAPPVNGAERLTAPSPALSFEDVVEGPVAFVDLPPSARVTITAVEREATREATADATIDRPPAPYVSLPIGLAPFENLSGTAGTGKTWMAKKLALQSPRGSVIVAATTGIAAVNLADQDVETTTINAALRYFNTAELQERYTTGVLQAILRKHRRAGVRRIIIDEKSMMCGQQLTCIARAIAEVNTPRDRSLEAVGQGDDYDQSIEEEHPQIALTLVGDFGQLPPVPDEDPKTGKKLPVQFCFDSPEWEPFAKATTTLTTIYRQDDAAFIRGLHAVRRADVSTALAFFTPDRFSQTTDDDFAGTTIFAKNEEVDRYNGLRLDRLSTPSMVFQAVRKGKPRPDWKNIPDRLALKEGALVMLLANRRVYDDEDDEVGTMIYANGDLGTIVGAAENKGGWAVRLHRNGQTIVVVPIIRQNTIPLEPGRRAALKAQYPNNWREYLTEDGRSEVIGSIFYMPLRAAWGATVHKSQGLSLDAVQVNLRDPFFRQPGMAFVALSRARTIEGLRIVGNQMGFVERLRVEPRVLPWL